MYKSAIEGVAMTLPHIFEDERGWLCELFRSDQIESAQMPAMAYCSVTLPGVTRGPHEHAEQTDRFFFTGMCPMQLFLWDNRNDSRTYGAHETFQFAAGVRVIVIVPPGVVHAYRNHGESPALVFNAPNRLYAGVGKASMVDEIRHERDPQSPFQLPPWSKS